MNQRTLHVVLAVVVGGVGGVIGHMLVLWARGTLCP